MGRKGEGILLAIANNITSRDRKVADALRPKAGERASHKAAERIEEGRIECLQGLARQCVEAGADILEINLQQHYDTPENMRFAVEAIQGAVDCQLCLSAYRAETLEAGAAACKRPPIINYVSLDEGRLQEVLPLASQSGADLILLLAAPTAPSDKNDILKTAAVMVGAANAAGIQNERLLVDPGIVHITSDIGPRYLSTVLELLPALSDTLEPSIRTTAWVGNVSAGIPARLRPAVNDTCLAMLAGAGLSSAFIDALNKSTMRTIRTIRILRNQVIYSARDVEL